MMGIIEFQVKQLMANSYQDSIAPFSHHSPEPIESLAQRQAIERLCVRHALSNAGIYSLQRMDSSAASRSQHRERPLRESLRVEPRSSPAWQAQLSLKRRRIEQRIPPAWSKSIGCQPRRLAGHIFLKVFVKQSAWVETTDRRASIHWTDS